MAGFFRRLFAGGDRPATVAPAPEVSPPAPALPDMPHGEWFNEDNGLSYPRWEQVYAWMDNNVPEADHHDALTAVVRVWMHRLGSELKGEFTTVDSTNFVLFSALARPHRQWVLQAAEEIRHGILETVGYEITAGWKGKGLLLVLEDRLYTRYAMHYYGDRYMAPSSGVMISGGGYVRIAIVQPNGSQFDWTFRRVLAHEFSHYTFCGELDLPKWLDEAIAMHFEDRFGGGEESIEFRLGHYFEVSGTKAILEEFKAAWTEERLQGFWSGDLWSSEEDDNAFCYEMARILFTMIRQSLTGGPAQFRAFLQNARWEDAGENAAQEHLGYSLGDLAAQFLGEGNWAPRPEEQ